MKNTKLPISQIKRIKRSITKSKQKKGKVEIIESAAGWGRKVEEVITFTNKGLAAIYVKRYNTRYNPPRDHAPEWYMIAQLVD